MRTETIKIVDMNDQPAATTISQALAELDGVGDVSISLDDRQATVAFDETLASKHGLRMVIEDLGFEVARPHGEDGGCCGGCGG